MESLRYVSLDFLTKLNSFSKHKKTDQNLQYNLFWRITAPEHQSNAYIIGKKDTRDCSKDLISFDFEIYGSDT